jgi:hypothetical protein
MDQNASNLGCAQWRERKELHLIGKGRRLKDLPISDLRFWKNHFKKLGV